MLASNNTPKKAKVSSAKTSLSQSNKRRGTPRSFIDNEDVRCVASPFALSEGIITPVLSVEMKDVLLTRLEKEVLSKLDGNWYRRSTSQSYRASISSESNAVGDNLMQANDHSFKQQIENDAAKESPTKPISSKLKGLPMKIPETILRSRFIVEGINQCTRVLEHALRERHKVNTLQQLQASATVSDTPEATSKHQKINAHLIPSLVLLTRDLRPPTIIAHIPIYSHILHIPTLILPGKASKELGKMLGIKTAAVAMFLPSVEGRSSDKDCLKEWKECQTDIDCFVKFVISKISA